MHVPMFPADALRSLPLVPDRVEISHVVDPDFGKSISLRFFWDGVDRPCGLAVLFRDDPKKERIAARALRAAKAGALFDSAWVGLDIHGKTYALGSCLISWKHAAAGLARIGF